jgi:TonB family protein
MLALLFTVLFLGQEGVLRPTANVIRPKLLKKVNPKYSSEARKAGVQGGVTLFVVIDERGKPTVTEIRRPLGFGLDDKARLAVEQWRFQPSLKNGEPVKVEAIVDVYFRLLEGRSQNAERELAAYTNAIAVLGDAASSTSLRAEAAKTLEKLAREGRAPAMYLVGMMRRSGGLLPRDVRKSIKLLRAAAAKKYGPAMYEVGMMQFSGNEAPLDREKGLTTLQDAAEFGSSQAQELLGGMYEAGESVQQELDRARRYYRLCAFAGVSACRLRLANMLFRTRASRGHDYVEAMAWYELASEQGVREATEVLNVERPKIPPRGMDSVRRMKASLIEKP